MGKIKRMDQIRSILETYVATKKNIKATARRLQISKNTVRHYLRIAKQYSTDIEQLLALPEADLLKVFDAPQKEQTSSSINSRASYFSQQVNYYIQELRKVGVTRRLLWTEYRQRRPNGYGYTQFCEHLNRVLQRRDLAMLLSHKAGEKLQIDFAGKGLYITDAHTGTQTKVEVLIAVLPHSSYTFAVAIPSQKVMDFIAGINAIFLFLTCLPKILLSDNLKSFVKKANRYDPDFNDLCIQLATHYGIDLEATRVAKPKDKASVENGVTNVYRQLYAPLRNEVFFNLPELNLALRTQADLLNDKPFQKKSGTRRQHFEDFERPVMASLPSSSFDIKRTISAKVQRTYHIMLGAEKNYYSVPFQYVGKQATVIYGTQTVEIFVDNQRVATHVRFPCRQTYKYKTDVNHMPKNHQEWLKTKGYTAQYFHDRAAKIGVATQWAIAQLIVGKIHESVAYKSCEGTLRLAKHYSKERLEAACERCRAIGKVNYKMLENILKRNLDQVSEQQSDFTPPSHDNIRGPKAYQ